MLEYRYEHSWLPRGCACRSHRQRVCGRHKPRARFGPGFGMSRSAVPRRGEIWWVDFGTPVGHEQGYRRPVVVVSADRLNSSPAGLVIVVPITCTRRGLPSHIEIEPGASGLPDVSYAKCEDVKSVSVQRLTGRSGQAPRAELRRIVDVIGLLLDG